MKFKQLLSERKVKVQDNEFVNIGDEVGFKDGSEKYGIYKGMKGREMKISVSDGNGNRDIVYKFPSDVWAE
jgi:hypothetical protein